MNIIKTFNRICMTAGEEWKTVFRTHLGLYKYLVLLFELSNSLGTFQSYFNNILENNILDILIIAYNDNILVFSKTL